MPSKKNVITGVVTVAAAITGWFGWQYFQPDKPKPEMTSSEPVVVEPAVDSMSVTLPPQKLEVVIGSDNKCAAAGEPGSRAASI